MANIVASAEHCILSDISDPVGDCLTPAVAARIVSLRAGSKTQDRLDKLAEKNSEGTLSEEEQAEYAAYVEALDVIAILQAKARNTVELLCMNAAKRQGLRREIRRGIAS